MEPQQTSPASTTAKKHIAYIDTAKGFCILLVVLFHSSIIDMDTPCLGMLRMPFYFTLSGMFFKDYSGFVATCVKKVNRLLIPFIFFYSLSYLMFVAIRLSMGGVIDLSFFSFVTSKTIVNTALWFLLALFWANIIFYFLTKLIKNIYLLALSTLIIGGLALYCFDSNNFLPMYIDSGLAALPFFMFGYVLRKTPILYPNNYDRYNSPIVIVLCIIAYILFIWGDKPYVGFGSMYCQGNTLAFFVGAFAIVTAMLLFCKVIGSLPFVNYIGKYSIMTLGIHLNILVLFGLMLKVWPIAGHDNLVVFMGFLITVLGCTASIPVFRKFFPYFTAQKDLINLNDFSLGKLKKVEDSISKS